MHKKGAHKAASHKYSIGNTLKAAVVRIKRLFSHFAMYAVSWFYKYLLKQQWDHSNPVQPLNRASLKDQIQTVEILELKNTET